MKKNYNNNYKIQFLNICNIINSDYIFYNISAVSE